MNKIKSFSGLDSVDFMSLTSQPDIPSVTDISRYDDEITYDYKNPVLGLTFPEKQPYRLDMRKSLRIIMFGKPGSGKSVVMQRILSLFHAGGGACAIPTDIKGNEYQLCNKPLQPKFHKNILLNYMYTREGKSEYEVIRERPMGLPIKVYRPFFFTNMDNRKFRNQIMCQFGLNDITRDDFITISGIEDKSPLSPTQKAVMDRLFIKISKGNIKTITDAQEYLHKSISKIGKATVKVLMTTLDRLGREGIVGSQFENSEFIEDIKNGLIPIQNTYGTQFSSKRTNPFAAAAVAIIIRKLHRAKANNEIKKHLLVLLDELPRFCPNEGRPSSREEIIKFFQLTRIENISILGACQKMDDIPSKLYDWSTHILIPGNANTDAIIEIMKQYAPWEGDNVQALRQSIQIRQFRMPKFCWFCLDTENKKTIILKPCMPLCYHRDE